MLPPGLGHPQPVQRRAVAAEGSARLANVGWQCRDERRFMMPIMHKVAIGKQIWPRNILTRIYNWIVVGGYMRGKGTMGAEQASLQAPV